MANEASGYRFQTVLSVAITLVALCGAAGVATAQAPGEDRPTAWTEMMLQFLETGEMPPPAVAGPSAAEPAPNFPGVSPIPNLNITPGGTSDQTETTVAVGLGAFINNIVVGYNDRAQLNGGLSGYSFSTDGGRTFTQSTAMPQPAGGNLLGDPVLDTHPAIPGRVYYASLCSGGTVPAMTLGICVSISNDGGQTFGAPVEIAVPTCNVNKAGDCDSFDKEWLAVDSFTGNVYIAYTNFVGGGPPAPPPPANGAIRAQIEAVVCDAALACSAPFVVFGPAATFLQGVSVTFGRAATQEMVLAWYNRTNGNIESTNCSVGAGPAITACAAPVTVVAVGTLAAAPYADAAATAGCATLTSLNPALRAASVPFPGFGAATVAGLRYEPFPVLAADNASFPGALGFTHLSVTFRNSAFALGATLNDVWYFRSADNGGTWPIGPTRVNDDLGTPTDQFFPHISAPKDDPSGRLNATWYDRRNDPSNLLIDVFHSESVSRGLTWNANGQVTDVSFPALPIPGTAANPFCYWGDYIGHASSVLGGHIYAAWGDDRRGQIDTFFAILHNTQDIRVNADLNFEVCRGDTATQALQIFNVGSLNLQVSNVSRVAGSAQITVEPNPQVPVTVSPDAHVDFAVRCTPTTFGPKTATIRIGSDDPDQPQVDVLATCNTPPGDVRVTGSTAFGDVCAGTQAEKAVSVCNVGKCDLAVTGVGFNPACIDFTLVNNPFPATVSPDSCEQVVIRFTPTSAGLKQCSLVVQTDDPDTPQTTLVVSANTPAAAIDVPPDLGFPPTVIQSVGACQSTQPFPVSNTGKCPLTITNQAITAGQIAYSLAGLPSFPIILEPGHIVGEGDLSVVFGPEVVIRNRFGALTVTYVSDPITGAVTNVARNLCGEGVRTGARVLVTENGVPKASVEAIHLHRMVGNVRKKRILQSVETAHDLPLVTIPAAAPCVGFQYHREYGTVSNQIQLAPGAYRLTVAIIDATGKRVSKTVGFDVQTCDFNANIVVNFP